MAVRTFRSVRYSGVSVKRGSTVVCFESDVLPFYKLNVLHVPFLFICEATWFWLILYILPCIKSVHSKMVHVHVHAEMFLYMVYMIFICT